MLHRIRTLAAATVFLSASVEAQDVVITRFENGHLSFSNSLPSGHRSVYTVEWRPNLESPSAWTDSWSGLQEFSGTGSEMTVDAPMFYRVAVYPDNLTTNPDEWWLMYSNAMVDASQAMPREVCNRLTPIVYSNTNLTWRTHASGVLQVKVASFMTLSTATSYYQVGEHSLGYGDQWVTVCPELKAFCALSEVPDPVLRIKQVLGMPPTAANDTIVEFWVSPDYLFRPAAEPGITSTSAGVVSSAVAPFLTASLRIPSFWADWYNSTYGSRNYGMTNGVYNAWPWTQLGYTYDWASTRPNHVGLSEFVIPSGTLSKVLAITVPIEVEALLPAATYGKL